MRNRRQVFFNCDARFIVPLLVVIDSLLSHNDPEKPIVVHIAHERNFDAQGCRERIKALVARYPFAEARFHDFSPVFARHADELSSESQWPPMVWAFPLFTELVPDISGTVVYLDVDMLIRRDLGELFDLDLASGGYLAAAVDECPHETRQVLEKCGWPKDAGDYFNNGTMVVDADAYRREGIAEKIPAIYAANRATFFGVDQDLQNVTLGTRTLRLPVKWNYSDTWLEQIPRRNLFADRWISHRPEDVLEAVLDPCIVHFMGRFKPWNYTHRPERGEYRAALAKLGLIGSALPGETPLKTLEGVLFDAYHRVLKVYARRQLARLRAATSRARIMV